MRRNLVLAAAFLAAFGVAAVGTPAKAQADDGYYGRGHHYPSSGHGGYYDGGCSYPSSGYVVTRPSYDYYDGGYYDSGSYGGGYSRRGHYSSGYYGGHHGGHVSFGGHHGGVSVHF